MSSVTCYASSSFVNVNIRYMGNNATHINVTVSVIVMTSFLVINSLNVTLIHLNSNNNNNDNNSHI